MNARWRSRMALICRPAVILLVVGMLLLLTFTAAASFPQNAGLKTNPNTDPPRVNGLEKSTFFADALPGCQHTVELRLDNLPGGKIDRQSAHSLDRAAAAPELVLDDGQMESVFGVNDGTNAHQFIWFNRFTPQASDFPFVLDEIMILFDNNNIDTNINVGDEIELVVYTDTDSDPINGADWIGSYSAEILAVDGVTWSSYQLSSPPTLTEAGDVLIGVINRYVVEGLSDPDYPAALDTTTSQDRSFMGWWSGEAPSPPDLVATDVLFLLFGEDGGNWLIRGYGSPSSTTVYLPYVVKSLVPPAIPTLFDIENADGDGAYTVSWSTSSQSTGYTLEEDDNAGFTSPTTVYNGPDTSKALAGKAIGDYYYRVRAENGSVFSDWSGVKTVSVTQQPPLICETHNFGTVGVSIQIPTTGTHDHFTAENNMLVETLEVKSSLKATFPTEVHVVVTINGIRLADKYHYVASAAWFPYYLNRTNLATELHVGDDIIYYISRTGDTPAYIGWGNYLTLCGR